MELSCRSVALFFGLSVVLLLTVVKSEPVPKCFSSYDESAPVSDDETSMRGRGRGGERMVEDERAMMGYSDSWVVEINGDKDDVERIANDNGFVNLGQVS